MTDRRADAGCCSPPELVYRGEGALPLDAALINSGGREREGVEGGSKGRGHAPVSPKAGCRVQLLYNVASHSAGGPLPLATFPGTRHVVLICCHRSQE